MKLLDCYSWIDIAHETLSIELPTAIEERLLIEAYRELPRDLQRDTLGRMLYYLQGPGALLEPIGTPKRALTIVKQDDICPAGRITKAQNEQLIPTAETVTQQALLTEFLARYREEE